MTSLKACRVVAATAMTIALVASTGLAASSAPVLRSVTQAHKHIVVTFMDAGLQPWLIEAAVSRATDASGAFLPRNVRLRERMTAPPDRATAVVRWRTRERLPARVYYVKVSGIESDGVTDCLPQQRDCLVHWSNALRLRVR